MLLVASSGMVVIAGIAAETEGAVAASGARAASAADASAHAAAAALAPGDARDQLSVTLQMGQRPCEFPYPREAPPPAAPNPAQDIDTDACQAAFDAAQRAARANDGAITFFVLGPDLRDDVPGTGPGRIQVVVHVAVRRKLPLMQRLCPDAPGDGGGICWAEATAAAERRWR